MTAICVFLNITNLLYWIKINYISFCEEYGLYYLGFIELDQDDEFVELCFRKIDESFAEETLEMIKEQIEEEYLVLK
jgi:hypothetical protein